MVPFRPKIKIKDKPITNGGVIIGNIENIRVSPENRLVTRTVKIANERPKKVANAPTRRAITREFLSVLNTPKPVIFWKNK